MSCNFVVGQKVVCIHEEFIPHHGYGYMLLHPIILPKKGTVYTVRLIKVSCGVPCILVKEIPDQICTLMDLHGVVFKIGVIFNASGFRPVVTRKTDISIFTSMLNTKNEGVDACQS
jgi:hypothetical protein